MITTAFAPASIGNLIVGFDSLGMAVTPIDVVQVPFGDRVSVTCSADQTSLTVGGPYAGQLPENVGENLVMRSLGEFKRRFPGDPDAIGSVAMTLEKNLPVGSGLGSSSSSIVAAIVSLNENFGGQFDRDQTLEMMGAVEASNCGALHFDNLAPCFLGGIRLVIDALAGRALAVNSFDDWYWVLAYPGTSVQTAMARDLLPQTYDRETCLNYGRRLAGFVHACQTSQARLAARLMIDELAEPYRRHLIPGYDTVKQIAASENALVAGIAGSGPSMFVLCDRLEQARQVEQALLDRFLVNDLGFVRVCKTDLRGATTTGDAKREAEREPL